MRKPSMIFSMSAMLSGPNRRDKLKRAERGQFEYEKVVGQFEFRVVSELCVADYSVFFSGGCFWLLWMQNCSANHRTASAAVTTILGLHGISSPQSEHLAATGNEFALYLNTSSVLRDMVTPYAAPCVAGRKSAGGRKERHIAAPITAGSRCSVRVQ